MAVDQSALTSIASYVQWQANEVAMRLHGPPERKVGLLPGVARRLTRELNSTVPGTQQYLRIQAALASVRHTINWAQRVVQAAHTVVQRTDPDVANQYPPKYSSLNLESAPLEYVLKESVPAIVDATLEAIAKMQRTVAGPAGWASKDKSMADLRPALNALKKACETPRMSVRPAAPSWSSATNARTGALTDRPQPHVAATTPPLNIDQLRGIERELRIMSEKAFALARKYDSRLGMDADPHSRRPVLVNRGAELHEIAAELRKVTGTPDRAPGEQLLTPKQRQDLRHTNDHYDDQFMLQVDRYVTDLEGTRPNGGRFSRLGLYSDQRLSGVRAAVAAYTHNRQEEVEGSQDNYLKRLGLDRPAVSQKRRPYGQPGFGRPTAAGMTPAEIAAARARHNSMTVR